MKIVVAVVALAALVFAVPTLACLRPTMDERAVQWSTAIVKAKLVSIGPRTSLGQIAERQGPRGALGQVTTTFAYRVYEFDVIDSLDGPLKKGQKVPVVRIFAVTDASIVGCAQHLTQAAKGRTFLLLLRPLGDFDLEMPTQVKRPDVKGGMVVVHLEPVEALKKDALSDLGDKIVQARSGEADATPANIQRRIQAVLKAPNDAKAEPAIRALIQMGPKVVPAVQKAEEKVPPAVVGRLERVVGELVCPDPITRVTRTNDPTAPKQDEGDM